MRLRTFLKLMAVFLLGCLVGALILVLHLPRWLEGLLGWIVTTITIGAMWALRAKTQTLPSNVTPDVSVEPHSTKASD